MEKLLLLSCPHLIQICQQILHLFLPTPMQLEGKVLRNLKLIVITLGPISKVKSQLTQGDFRNGQSLKVANTKLKCSVPVEVVHLLLPVVKVLTCQENLFWKNRNCSK